MKIEVDVEGEDEIVSQSLLDALKYDPDLSNQERQSYKLVLSHYMIKKDYDQIFGEGAFDKITEWGASN